MLTTNSTIIIIMCCILFVLITLLFFLIKWSNKHEENIDSNARIKKTIATILFIISGVPIITYPFVLIADIMGLAALFEHFENNPDIIKSLGMLFFLFITAIYPLIYLLCLFLFFGKKGKKNVFIPLIPFLNLVLILGIISISSYYENHFDSDGNYQITNIEIFKDTAAWKLALAVKNEQAENIQKILRENPELLNYQERKNGITLLLWAIKMKKYNSAEALLKCGADPNIPAKGELGTPLLVAVEGSWESEYSDDPRFVKLLLEYKADPNKGYVGEDTLMIESGTSPLLEAAYHGLEKTKALVEGGADINYKTRSGRSAAINALISGSIYEKETESAKVAYYLIVEKKAKITEPYYSEDTRKKYFPVDLLRNWVSDLNSKEYKMKMEIVKEFSRQGVNYWDTKISDDRLKVIQKKYPDSWHEFIKVY